MQTELSATLGVSQDQTLITNKVYGISPYESNAMKSNNPHSGIYEADTARTLDLNGGSPACNQGGMVVVQGADVFNGQLTGEVAATLTAACGGANKSGAKVVCLEGNGSRPSHLGDGYSEGETMYTLNSAERHAVAFRKQGHPQNVTGTLSPGGHAGSYNGQDAYNDMLIAATLNARDYKGPCAQDLHNDMANYPIQNSIVRRLTPLECERLQGFPDGWTDIGEWEENGKAHKESSDSSRYKALGNSIALPYWRWLIKRISATYPRNPTLGSLFDGIGGFCLCWERTNGVGTARWASEIEPFCIAVTKKHFGDGEKEGDIRKYL